jgi:hypothetical protein
MFIQINPLGNPARLLRSWLYPGLLAFYFLSASGVLTSVAAPISPSFTSIEYLSDRSVQLGISGATDSVYLLQFSDNLAGWTPLASLANMNGALQFNDMPPRLGFNGRFYRLQSAVASNSIYWTNAQQTHNFAVGKLLTPFNSYSFTPGTNIAYEWCCVSQIYADAVMTLYGDSRYVSYLNNSYGWMNNLWDNGSPVGGYFSTANIDGTGQRGGKYVDDNSLAGNVYLDCYAISTGVMRSNYLNSAVATANWLMFSGQWDGTYGGGFWWSDSKTLKPTQSNGLAEQLFLRLYQITGKPYYASWANSINSWLNSQMYNTTNGLYVWEIVTNGTASGAKSFVEFTYDNAIMIETDLLYWQVMSDSSYLGKAQALAKSLNSGLWNNVHNVYNFNTADGRVNPCWCGWASQSLIKLYQADGNAKWLNYAQLNVDFMNSHLRDGVTGGYYPFCNTDGSNVQTQQVQEVDQAWMERVQGMLSSYR